MGKRQRQQEPCWRFAEGSCQFGAQCWFAHSRAAEQPDTNAASSGSSKIEKMAAEFVGEVFSEVKKLKQELHDSEQARAELQRELDERTKKEDELRLERLEDSRRSREQVVSIQAECEELKERLREALARPSGASSSQLAYRAGFCGAEWCFESGPDEWTSLPADRSADLLRHFQDFKKGGDAIFHMRSGVEEYTFDLSAMSQTNRRTGTSRAIRCKLHVPSNWTRCTSLESICQARDPESYELSGFWNTLINGTYMRSDFHYIHGCSVWWHVLGTAVMYELKHGSWLVLRVNVNYSDNRTAMAYESCGIFTATCEGFTYHAPNCDELYESYWSEIVGDDVWNDTGRARKAPWLNSASPLMEIAVEFWEKSVLEGFAKLLRDSVVHETQHYGASCCSAFMDTFEVVRVLRIENWHLWMKYANHLEQVRQELSKLGVDLKAGKPALPAAFNNLPPECGCPDTQAGEYMLFHGTDYETAAKIAFEGFDFRLSKPGYYGRGTYFASQACKSHQYTVLDERSGLHTIILGRVVVGDVAYADKVDRELTRPPTRMDISRPYDTVVAEPGPMLGHRDGQQTHQEFVIFDKSQAYPEFLIQYKCEA